MQKLRFYGKNEAELYLLFEIFFVFKNTEGGFIMADTAKGHWQKENCSDCGEFDVIMKHWGPLVPEGKIGFFCLFCWNEREEDWKEGKEPKPLGAKPPIEEIFIDKKIKVITKTGSVYQFSKPDSGKIRTVVKDNRPLPFSLCRIICLKEGKPLYFMAIPIDNNKKEEPWFSTKILSIEIY